MSAPPARAPAPAPAPAPAQAPAPARAHARGDGGAITLFVSVMAVALFAAVGLVVDGGGRLHALSEARRTAAEGARTAGQYLDPVAVTGGERPRPDTAAAARAARRYLEAAGVSGEVAVSGGRIVVRTEVEYEPVFLSVIGLGVMHLTGSAEAVARRGTDRELP